MRRLAAAGKKLIILSNDGARKAGGKSGVSKLGRMGFDTSALLGSVIAGEEAIQWMLREYAPAARPRKLRVAWFAWSGKGFEPGYLDGLDAELAPCDRADLLVAQGTARLLTDDTDRATTRRNLRYDTTGDIGEVAATLAVAAARGVPMVCCNPDLLTVRRGKGGEEAVEYCPGGFARHYEGLGGEVHWFGKPHTAHFEACLRELGLPRDRVAMVGDALETDVAGAAAAGLASVLVASGIHGTALGCVGPDAGPPPAAAVEALCAEFGAARPSYVVPRFAW
jgi:ribonucleotide monophosphatase NagD (HAD superfamily)